MILSPSNQIHGLTREIPGFARNDLAQRGTVVSLGRLMSHEITFRKIVD